MNLKKFLKKQKNNSKRFPENYSEVDGRNTDYFVNDDDIHTFDHHPKIKASKKKIKKFARALAEQDWDY